MYPSEEPHGRIGVRIGSGAPLHSTAAPPARYVVGWLASTWVTLVFTFDPFVASFPFVIGLGLVCYACHHEPELRVNG
jgi:hypothetical protein